MEDSLEAGWVAVRPDVFEEKEKHKFVFIVAWNKVEGMFAITCHNRTVQKRKAARDARATVAAAIIEDKSGHLKSPAKENTTDFISTCGRSVEGGGGIKIQLRGKSPVTRSPVKRGSQTSRLKSTCHAGVMEVLEPPVIKGEICTPLVETVEPQDFETYASEGYSWAGLFSFQDLRAIHFLLCSVSSDLETCLPCFPEVPSGTWTVLFGHPEVTQAEMDNLCHQLQLYLCHALDICGWKILSEVLFTENDDPDEYYESLSELRLKGYEEELQRAQSRLHELLEMHKATESMVELLQIYQEEDEAHGALVEATTQLYQYLLQPFRDMRELAALRRQQIKISIENDHLGPHRMEALRKEDSEWQRKAHTAVLSIQEFTIEYFEITARAQKVVFERMRADERKFGRAAWSAAAHRLERLQCGVSMETLQLMRTREICLEQSKHSLRDQMQALQGGEEAMVQLDQLEAQYYALQLRLYEIQLEILKCEELLLSTQRESLKRQMTESQDEVVYYDAYETTEALLEAEDPALRREELLQLQQRVRQLEARRGRIAAKKVYLRNKKEICIANYNQKMQKRQGSQEDYTSLHALHQPSEHRVEGNEGESKQVNGSRVSQERQKTLDRLRSFKQRYPGQVVLKSYRVRLAFAQRKNGSSATRRAGVDQPASVTASAQAAATVSLSSSPPMTAAAVVLLEKPPGGTATPHLASSCPPDPVLQEPVIDSSLPPPPPPPLPPLSDEPPGESEGHPSSYIQRAVEGRREPAEPPITFLATHFFDSSQLVNARKKLKKTTVTETSPSSRASCPMDEVLASLKRGSFHLRSVEQRAWRPELDEDAADTILVQIRRGVTLRKVGRQDTAGESAEPAHPANSLNRSISEAMQRIKEASPESEDEGALGSHWDS